MRPTEVRSTLLLALAGALLLPPGQGRSEPGEDGARRELSSYAFSKVADDTGPVYSFDPTTMAVNAGGAVAVRVLFDDYTGAIVRFEDQTMTTIADTTAMTSFGDLDINDAGTVAFTGDPVGEPSSVGVFAGDGGGLVTIGPVPAVPYYPTYTLRALDNSGLALMARHEQAGGNVVALVAGDGGPIVTIYDTSDLPEGGVFADGDLSRSGGVVVMAGPFIGSRHYVYKGLLAGTALVLVASPALTYPDSPNFGSAAINSANRVAFIEGSWGDFSAVYSGLDEASLTTIATTDDPFSSFGGAAINGSGLVVFQAVLDGGSGTDTGVFVGPDPVAHRVIGTGDPLDGSTVSLVSTNQRCLNESGQLLVYAILDDGRQGLYLAQVALFADGFESGDTSRWSATVGG